MLRYKCPSFVSKSLNYLLEGFISSHRERKAKSTYHPDLFKRAVQLQSWEAIYGYLKIDIRRTMFQKISM